MTAPQFYGNALRCAPIYAIEALALAGSVWTGWRNAHLLAPTDRRLLFALVSAGIRPHRNDLRSPRAESRLAGFSLANQILLRAPGVGRAGRRFSPRPHRLVHPARAQRAARWIAGAVIAGFWLLVSFWYLERALAIDAARIPAGRQGNTALAVRRRADFDVFQRDIETLARRIGRQQIDIPPPLGLYWAHPCLEFGFDSVLGGTYLFTDLLSVAPSTGITLRERPRAEILQ